MPSTFSTPHRDEFVAYEQASRAKQKEFLEGHQFKEVSIKDPRDIQAGDHLIARKEGLYDHHMLCTDICTDQITIIEYTGPVTGSNSVSSVASKDLTVFGKIVEKSYPVTQFMKKKILKIIWPRELERFSVTEVIKRARSRLNETWYDVLKNNCEHFVTWCKCGLSVSRQVKNWFLWARDFVYSVIAGLYHQAKKETAAAAAAVPLLIEITANISDEVAGFCAQPEIVGAGFCIFLESWLAVNEIRKAWKYCKTDREFWFKVVDVVAKAVFRLGGGFLGSWLGAMLWGPLGSLVCGGFGAGLGHLLASFIA